VVTEDEGGPVVGALVEMLGGEGSRLHATLSNMSGAFSLPPGNGPFTIHVRRIGFAEWVSSPLQTEDGRLSVTVELSVAAIPLPELVAEGTRRCRVPASEAERSHEVYEAAMRALEPVAWAETEALYVYQVETHATGPDTWPGGARLRRQDRGNTKLEPEWRAFIEAARPTPPETTLVESPVSTAPPSELADRGFVRVDEETRAFSYYPMSAATFLSPAFRDTHCFRASDRDDGAVGLAFKPVSGREVADVSGVVWLNADLDAPLSLDFRYTGLEDLIREHHEPLVVQRVREEFAGWDARRPSPRLQVLQPSLQGESGGTLEFDRIRNGAWITRRWDLRFPILTRYTAYEEGFGKAVVQAVALQRTRSVRVTAVMAHASRP